MSSQALSDVIPEHCWLWSGSQTEEMRGGVSLPAPALRCARAQLCSEHPEGGFLPGCSGFELRQLSPLCLSQIRLGRKQRLMGPGVGAPPDSGFPVLDGCVVWVGVARWGGSRGVGACEWSMS